MMNIYISHVNITGILYFILLGLERRLNLLSFESRGIINYNSS